MAVELTDGIKWYLAFVFSTGTHEAAHAWAAWKLGDDTAARGGQMTLDPTPHIRREPFGMVVVPILSYLAGGWMIGWASAPYDPQWALRFPRKAALMALAGPSANLLIALVSAALLLGGRSVGFFLEASRLTFSHLVDAGPQEISVFAGTFLSIFFSLNLLLAAFNLIPLPPLDGAAASMLVLPERAARRWMQLTSDPRLRVVGLLVVWNLFGVVFTPLYSAIARFVFFQHH
jgi:Zn-dependent protease